MQVLLFTFGSNMSSARLRERIAEAQSLGRAQLEGWRLRCNKSGMDGTAKANIEAEQGAVVWGVVYRIPAAALPELDVIEGGYERITVEVLDDAGDKHSCHTYTSRRLTDEPLLPNAWYKQHILQGAAEHGLPSSYRAQLVAWPTLPQDSE